MINKFEIALAQCKLNPYNLNKVSTKIRSKKEYVLEFVKIAGYAIQFCNPKFLNDRDVVLEACKHDDSELENGLTLDFANEKFYSDKTIILAAVKRCGLSLKYASKDLRNDKDVIKNAIKYYGAIEYVGDEIKKDTKFFNSLVYVAPSALLYSDIIFKKVEKKLKKIADYPSIPLMKHLSNELKDDYDFMKYVVSIDKDRYKDISKRLKNDRSILCNAIIADFGNDCPLKWAAEDLRDDEEVVTLALLYDSGSLFDSNNSCIKYASDRLKEKLKNFNQDNFDFKTLPKLRDKLCNL